MYLLIWRGWGIVVPVISFVAIVGAVLFLAGLHLDLGPNPEAAGALGEVVGGAIAFVTLFFLVRAIEGKPIPAPVDGQIPRRRPSAGSFFFIPTRYWVFITPGLALALAALAMFGQPIKSLHGAASTPVATRTAPGATSAASPPPSTTRP